MCWLSIRNQIEVYSILCFLEEKEHQFQVVGINFGDLYLTSVYGSPLELTKSTHEVVHVGEY